MRLNILLALACVTLLCGCAAGQKHNYGACLQAGSAAGNCRQQQLIAACTATANSYPYFRDRLLYEGYGNLMTEDALFQIEGQPQVSGREAIVNALRERGPKVRMRHLSHVVHMRATGDNTAEGVSYVNIWREDSTGAQNASETGSGPWLLGEYHDQFRMEGDICRISQRFVKIVFQNNNK